jgi:thioredoxin 1
MKNTFVSIAILVLIICCFGFVQRENQSQTDDGKGIHFSSISLDSGKLLARKTGKLIFIDVHTSWCGPCKAMAKGPFQDEKVGTIFNEKFINLKIDAEKGSDGEFVARAYAVQAYPTLLFINGKGKLVKKVIGYQSSEDLLSLANVIK